MANNDLIASILQNLCNNGNNFNCGFSFNDLLSSIIKLNENIEKLTLVLTALLSKNVQLNSNFQVPTINKLSYSNALSGHRNSNTVSSSTLATNDSRLSTNISNELGINKPNSEKTDEASFMQNLINLKNLQVDAYYKMQRNIILASMYTKNLGEEKKRIPKKFEPTFFPREPNEMKNHKIKGAIQQTENEIQALNLHKEYQEKKFQSLNDKIRAHILTHPDKPRQNVLLRNYERIIKTACERIDQKMKSKASFYNSNLYMVTLSIFKTTSIPQVNEQFLENEYIDIDNISIRGETQEILQHVMAVEDKTNKRRASNSLSSSSSQDTNNKPAINCTQLSLPVPTTKGKNAKLQPATTSSQPTRSSSMEISKNSNAHSITAKMK